MENNTTNQEFYKKTKKEWRIALLQIAVFSLFSFVLWQSMLPVFHGVPLLKGILIALFILIISLIIPLARKKRRNVTIFAIGAGLVALLTAPIMLIGGIFYVFFCLVLFAWVISVIDTLLPKEDGIVFSILRAILILFISFGLLFLVSTLWSNGPSSGLIN